MLEQQVPKRCHFRLQFAQHAHSNESVAIKFFLNRSAFDVEEGLYLRPGLQEMMPAITMIENNESVCMPQLSLLNELM